MPHRQANRPGGAPNAVGGANPTKGKASQANVNKPKGNGRIAVPPNRLWMAIIATIIAVGAAVLLGQRAVYKGLYIIPIPRVANLSYAEFYHKYAKTARPVIVTDYTLTTKRWTLEYIESLCGDSTVELQVRNNRSRKWAKLEYSRSMVLREYLQYYRKQAENPSDKNPLYMFDWGIGKSCPKLAEDLIVPKYFAGDYFKRTPGENGAVLHRTMNNWPSLFLGNTAAGSALHIDFANTAFWMGMVQGRKKWYVLPRRDADNIYRIDGSNAFEVDLMAMQESGNVDFKRFPKLRKITVMEATLGPNELLFVPAGCPHQVRNVDDNIAIAGNFVDESNFEIFLEGFRKHITQNGRAPNDRDIRVEAHFRGEEFAKERGMDSLQEDMTWKEYDSWPKPAFKGERLM